MKRWTLWFGLALLVSVAASGCSNNYAAAGSLTISPTTPTVLVNSSIQFTGVLTGTVTTTTWSINGSTATSTAVGGTLSTIGTIDVNGIYTAPPTVPASGTTITITGTAQGATASTTVTIDSGVRVVIAQSGYTIGTNETFPFTATVTGACNTAISCTAVTWSVTGTNPGTIDPGSGLYQAPAAATTATITATSTADPNQKGTATVTIVTAAPPTVSSLAPNTGAIGSVFEDVYLTGTNFISTTNVFVNCTLIPPGQAIATTSSTSMRVRVPASLMSTLPTSGTTAVLNFAVTQQSAAAPAPPSCGTPQLVLSLVRPAIVGTTPDSFPVVAGTVDFNINGGYFGAPGTPVVTASIAGQSLAPSVANPGRQLIVPIAIPGNVPAPGLYPVQVSSSVSGAAVPPAIVNVAFQPTSGPTPVGLPLPVGTKPVAVAINTATGIAVVANQTSNDVTLVDMTPTPPVVNTASICTAAVGATAPTAPCAASSPTGVAVDNLRNVALVTNSNGTVAVINLGSHSVTGVLNLNSINNRTVVPASVGIEPISGTAIVAYQNTNFASLLAMTALDPCGPNSPAGSCGQATPAVLGVVSANTGTSPRVAVSPKLNWAMITPGGLGSLSIVDLNQQTVNAISGGTASGNVATVTTTTAHALQAGESVLIQGMSDASFNGVYQVSSVPSSTSFTFTQTITGAPTATGGSVGYSLPVATIATNLSVSAIALNDQTGKAIFVDPTGGVPGTILNILDQTSTGGFFPSTFVGNTGAAVNPLTNTDVVVNSSGTLYTIDPTTPSIISSAPVAGSNPVDVAIDPASNQAIIADQGNTVNIVSLGALRSPQILQTSPAQVVVGSTLAAGFGNGSDQTLTVIGSGFISGTSFVYLDGTELTSSACATSRECTATVPGSMLGGPRRYAVTVENSTTAVSNASSFTVIRSVDLTETGCTAAPAGVAIDPQSNLAVVSNSGCNNVALVNLATGTGTTVSVGTTPMGVGVLPQLGLAVVANQGSNNASIINESGATVTSTVTTDVGPTGVAVDLGSNEALISATTANTVDLFSLVNVPAASTACASGTASTSVTTCISLPAGSAPVGISIDPTRHWAAVANTVGNNVSRVDLTGAAATIMTNTIQSPLGVAFDPVSSDFIVASNPNNQAVIMDPNSGILTSLRVGISPSAIAYNFESGTLVTANALSHTMTVVDFLDRTVRAVFSLAAGITLQAPAVSGEYAVDIHPQTNLAVVADSANNRVLLLPLPQ